VSVPFKSKDVVGVAVPVARFRLLPTLIVVVPVCVRIEFSMLVVVVNIGIEFAVPPVVVTPDDDRGETALEVAESVGALDVEVLLPDGAASTKAEAGNPPRVWASAAFMA
jgi:hypothetical protein